MEIHETLGTLPELHDDEDVASEKTTSKGLPTKSGSSATASVSLPFEDGEQYSDMSSQSLLSNVTNEISSTSLQDGTVPLPHGPVPMQILNDDTNVLPDETPTIETVFLERASVSSRNGVEENMSGEKEVLSVPSTAVQCTVSNELSTLELSGSSSALQRTDYVDDDDEENVRNQTEIDNMCSAEFNSIDNFKHVYDTICSRNTLSIMIIEFSVENKNVMLLNPSKITGAGPVGMISHCQNGNTQNYRRMTWTELESNQRKEYKNSFADANACETYKLGILNEALSKKRNCVERQGERKKAKLLKNANAEAGAEVSSGHHP